MRKIKLKYRSTIITAVASVTVILLCCFIYAAFPRYNPNVFLTFQYTSNHYYKILINDSVIIDSDGITRLKDCGHHKMKTLDLELAKGNYSIQIKNSNDSILSEAALKIENTNPKFIYFRKEIVLTDRQIMLD